jgi:hypothetical protein
MIKKPFTSVASMARGLVDKVTGGGIVGKSASGAATAAQTTAQTAAGAATSASAVKPSAGLGIKMFLQGLASGLTSMGTVRVLGGALNLIPASLGLIAMIPGALGAFLLSKIDGMSLVTSLTSLAVGLTAMASTSVLAGAGALAVTSLALVIMTPGLIAMAGIALLGTSFSAGLVAMSAGLSALGGNPVAWLGIAAVAALSLAFVGFAFGIKLIAEGLSIVVNSFSVFGDLDWSTIAKGFVTMLGLGAVAVILGMALPFIIAGAVSLGVLSVAMLAFGAAMQIASPGLDAFDTIAEKLQLFGEISWGGVAKGVATMVAAAASFAVLGFGSMFILAGAGAIGFMSLAMIGFGKAMEIAEPGFEIFSNVLDKIGQIGGDGLFRTALGITALSGALAAFGAGSAAAGLGSFAGKLLGGDPIKRLQRFIDIGPKLRDSAESIDKIASATAKFGMIDAFAMAVDRLVYSLQKLNDQLDKTNTLKVATLSVISAMTQKDTETPTTTTTTETTGGGLEAKLDELITLLKDGAISIDLDGERVSRAMAARGRE